MRRTLGVGAALLVLSLLASCGNQTPAPTATPAASSTPDVTGTPASSATPLAIETLPAATFDPATLTAVCDPALGDAAPDDSVPSISCAGGLLLGLRALSATGLESPTRLYLQRQGCSAFPCTDAEINTAAVIAWNSTGIFRVDLDSRLETVSAPYADPTASWPEGGDTPELEPARPALPGTPTELTDREPYPFCGSEDVATYEPGLVSRCFRDEVLAGRRVEYVLQTSSTEGTPVTWLYRYAGQGAIMRWVGEDGTWTRQEGSLVLGLSSYIWDFDPWP